GTYEVEFNASALPSGIYFYELKTGSFAQTKKMILMK
ncbi:MAG: T9SS type A sorting domain-containing protein, partial [Ignavibacteriaceae bacterium]|nr:T9SS type A sorting domain-containing protein [Ignavibacteriaceae bacterium]